MSIATRRIIYAVAVVIGAVAFGFGIIDREAMDTLTTQIVDVVSSIVMVGAGLTASLNTHRGSDSLLTEEDLKAEKQEAYKEGRKVGATEANGPGPGIAPVQYAPESASEEVAALPDPMEAAQIAYAAATAPVDDPESARHALRGE